MLCWLQSVRSWKYMLEPISQIEELMVLFFSHFLKKRCFQDFDLEMLGANEEFLGLKKLSERLHFLIY